MKRKKISIKNLKKKFFEKEVLKKLNLDVFESESLAIIGESGSGKSVLTRCIIGLIEFDEGTVSFDEIPNIKNLGFRGRTEYISKFGILFQNSALLDSLTIFELTWVNNLTTCPWTLQTLNSEIKPPSAA